MDEFNPEQLHTGIQSVIRETAAYIAARRFDFVARLKHVPYKEKPDVVTDVDEFAQQKLIKGLRILFPRAGFVTEEEGGDAASDGRWFWTVDPLDGTRAFIRQDTQGISVMVSLVQASERPYKVVAAYVCDVLTGDLFSAPPDDAPVTLTDRFGHVRVLGVPRTDPLEQQYLLLGNRPVDHYELQGGLFVKEGIKQLFRSYDLMSGSIGSRMARLWSGAVAMAIWQAGPYTPWDFCPVYGISRRMGFNFYRLDDSFLRNELRVAPVGPRTDTDRHTYDLLVLHDAHVPAVNAWLSTFPR